ncbi:MAG: GYF domain-containing protein [Muribaculum sp.]|nr:GYF domain-containing protein [Muribaculum sp.]
MIDGEQRGPFLPEELPAAGVRPSTYVWCKEMTDWEKAEDVPEVCRVFRQHLAGVLPPPSPHNDSSEPSSHRRDNIPPSQSENPDTEIPRLGFRGFPEVDEEIDYNVKPPSMIASAIAVTLLCMPLTGLVAIYYAWRIRRQWDEAEKASDAAQTELRKEAYNSLRLCRMWLGITIFTGLVLQATLFFRN